MRSPCKTLLISLGVIFFAGILWVGRNASTSKESLISSSAPSSKNSPILNNDSPIASNDDLPCADPLRMAIAESSLSFPLKSLLTLFVSTLTPQSMLQLSSEALANKKVLIKDAKALSLLIESTECARVESSVTLGICTVFSGIHFNFQEWMLHYLFLGASHIVVYDTSLPNSTEYHALQSDAKPFVEAGLLTLIPRYRSASESIDAVQIESFTDCYRRTLSSHTFIATFDADEFLVLKNANCLPKFLESFADKGGLRVPWHTFSPANVGQHDSSRSYVSQYNSAFISEPSVVIHIKTIGTVEFFQGQPNQHFITSSRDLVDSKFVVGQGPFIDKSASMYDDLELRHYYAPDWASFLYEKVCGSGQGRTQHARVRATALIGFLDTSNIEDAGGYRVNGEYFLDQLFKQ